MRHAWPLVLLLLPGATALGEEPADPFRSAADGIVPRLEALADWCEANKLRRERAKVQEAILLFRPDHAAARRALGYRREGGSWTRRAGHRSPRGTNVDLLPEYRRRRAEIVVPFVKQALAAISENPPRPDRRDRLLGDLVRLAPDDAAVRAARGEARLRVHWVLAETKAAVERRTELRRIAADLLREEPPAEKASLDKIDRAIGLAWTGAFRRGETRVVGMPSATELRRSARLSSVSAELCRRAFGVSTRLPRAFTIHLLRGGDEWTRYLGRHPDIAPADREFSRKLPAVWTRWSVGISHRDASYREELVARQTVSLMLMQSFGILTKHGALHEGLGLYLGRLLTGRRRVWFSRRSEYGQRDPALQDKLRDAEADWLKMAWELRTRGRGPDYAHLLGLDVNGMKLEELVHAYVLAAYLIEGRPDGWIAFLGSVRAGTHPAEAAEKHLGRSLPELQRRVGRWLQERTLR